MEKSTKIKMGIIILVLLVVILIVVPVLFFTVFASDDSKFIGFWKSNEEESNDEVWIFYDNGYFEIINTTKGNQIQSMGTWSTGNNHELSLLHITEGYANEFQYTFHGDRELELRGNNRILHFYKRS